MEHPAEYGTKLNESAAQLQHQPEDEPLIDPYGLPFEALDEVSDAPLEFEELTESLWEDLTDTYILATRYNRRSPYYLMLCHHLEKDIRQLGSLCITKAVLEQKDMKFPKLEGLSIKELYTMVSLHFRKCHSAFQDIRREGKGIDLSLLDWTCRWASLAEKLKATEEKIRKIQNGKIDPDKLLERAQVFKGETRGKRPAMDVQEIRNASSLPIIASYARELVQKKRQHDLEKAREERRRYRLEHSAKGSISTPMIRPAPAGDTTRIENLLRERLLENAKRSGDPADFEEIMNMDLDELKARYFQRSPGSVSSPSRPPGRTGPSDEVRKKLRDKRKKRK